MYYKDSETSCKQKKSNYCENMTMKLFLYMYTFYMYICICVYMCVYTHTHTLTYYYCFINNFHLILRKYASLFYIRNGWYKKR